MRILRLAIGVYPERIGGTEMNVARISEGQARRGHDVEVHAPRPPSPGPSPDGRPFRVRFYDPGRVVFGNPLSLHPMREIRKARGTLDVVHGHSHLYFGSNVAAMACRRHGIPFVLTSEGIYSQTAPMAFQHVFMRSVGAYTFRAATLVLCHSREEGRALVGLGVDPARVRVITQGIDTDFFSPRPKLGGPLRLLWAGRHAPGKGADIALRALARVRDEGLDAQMTLLGEGPGRPQAEALARELRLQDAARFVGFVDEPTLREVYAQADLLVLPSVSEGMSRTVLESLACGTPALTSDIPQLAELLEDCGGTARERTPAAFAEAIRALAGQDLRALGERGRRKVVERHAWSRTHEDVEAAFLEIARR